ncbi:RDD family protein [Sphingomonas lacunae]|uniref:RDD family protein n=1 Tax=Sphingomonas lacunae TaxID=2698828 RepID=A0A6M4AUA3_9SPHN|nr:RDD family protein [Sphingomonas lacunae]QJQ32000.1 RDD family protein [Sphingomonas lacunae]
MNAPAHSPAAAAARAGRRRHDKVRHFVTPEGVDLSLEIASAGLRLVALCLDLLLMLAVLIMASIILGVLGLSSGEDSAGFVSIIWLLGFFLLRNFWFVLFELGPRAATPGKRAVGIRVVARDGGRLTVPSVMARNLVREGEIFLPLAFITQSMAEDSISQAIAVFGMMWTLGLGFFLLFNKDRMRLGDLIGGTWVVMAKRKKMAVDLAETHVGTSPGAPVFTPAELSVYGIYELQELERVLRQRDPQTMIAVSDAIRAKIGHAHGVDDQVFLTAYYRQLKARMERDLLFGKRRENKYEELK